MLFTKIEGQDRFKTHFFTAVHYHRLPHAYLIAGGSHDPYLALAIAAMGYLHCTDKRAMDSCGSCLSCTMMSKGHHPDIELVLPGLSQDTDIAKAKSHQEKKKYYLL